MRGLKRLKGLTGHIYNKMQRLEVQITQIEAEIKEVKEEAAKENDPAIKLEAMKQLTALRTHINEIEKQKTFLMQQEGESQLLALLIKSKIAMHG